MGVESGTTKEDFADYFARTIVTAIRDKTASIVVDVGSPAPQVAGYKEIFSFIQSYLYWLELKLTNEDVISSLLEGAEKLVSLNELDVATIFYDKCIARVDLWSASNPSLPLTPFLVMNKVQAMYGVANNAIKDLLRYDKYVKYPNTLKHMLGVLRQIQSGMTIILELPDPNKREELAWLLLNGTTRK